MLDLWKRMATGWQRMATDGNGWRRSSNEYRTDETIDWTPGNESRRQWDTC
jgi:hypothetical protein